MLYATLGQLPVFLWMTAAGALIGAWYALLAGLRRLLRAGFWLSLAADVGFGAGAAVLFCAALYAANYGRLRLYAALAAGLGFALFMLGAYPPLRRLARAFAKALCQLYDAFREFRWNKIIFK